MCNSALERTKLVSDIVAVWVGLIALLIGGGFALVEYLEKAKAERVKVTLEFLERHGQSPVVDARKNVLAAWRKREQDLGDIVKASPAKFDKYVLDTMKDENLYADVELVLDFYDALQTCIAYKLCEKSTSHALFKKEATAFFHLHYPYIEVQRTQLHDDKFAGPLQSLVLAKSAAPK